MRTALALTVAIVLPLASSHGVEFVKDPSGATGYSVPKGWKVSAGQEGGIAMWRADENPGAADSPGVAILALPDGPEVVADGILEFIGGLTAEQRVSRSHRPSRDDAHFLIDATIEGTPSKIVAHFLRDRASGLVFYSIYAVPAARYDRLGAESLLYSVTGQQNPFPDLAAAPGASMPSPGPSPSPAADVALNLQDPEVRAALLNASAAITPEKLHGSWLQVMSYATGDDYLDGSGGLRLGQRGYAHLLELKPDGSYRLTYQYQNTVQGISNSASFVESGRYRLVDGNQLHLQRSSYSGEYLVGGQRSNEQKRNPPARAFLLGLCPRAKHLVLHGHPFEYSVATDTNEAGEEYFQQGFHRQDP